MDALRIKLLEVCDDQTLSMSGIQGREDQALQALIQTYTWLETQRLIRALALAGLLFASGKTRNTRYKTTKVGRIAAQALRERQYLKPDELP